MLEQVKVTKHLKALGRGGSNPQIFATEDNAEYVVKYMQNAQDLKIMVNEYVASSLLKKYNFFTPEPVFIEIDENICSTLTPVNGVSITKGPHFGTKRISDIYIGPYITNLIAKCLNIAEFPSMILFDAYVFNNDRCNPDNQLIVVGEQGWKLCAIDYGHSFNCKWDLVTLNTIKNFWTSLYSGEMYSIINGKSDFDDAISTTRNLDSTFITKLVDGIPLEWLSDATEKKGLIDYLEYKKSVMETLLLSNKSKFMNWL